MAQAGTTKKRGSKWTAYYWVRGEDGQIRQASKGGFQTKTDARAHLTDVLKEIKDGSYTKPAAPMSLQTYLVEHYLPNVRKTVISSGEEHRKESTVAFYTYAVNSWILPHLGSLTLLQITPKKVETWLETLRESGAKDGKPLSGATVRHALKALRMALRWAVEDRIIPKDPLPRLARIKVPASDAREMDFWSREEVQRFLASVQEHRLHALWHLLLSRGLRRGELAGLKWTDVDLEGKRLHVRRSRTVVNGKVIEGKPKTRKAIRAIPLTDQHVTVLRAHHKRRTEERLRWGGAWKDSGYVFCREDGAAVNPERLSDDFAALAKKAGLRVIRFHDGRHTAASLLLAGGASVKEVSAWLGHASVQITYDLYAHLVRDVEDEQATRADAYIFGGGA